MAGAPTSSAISPPAAAPDDAQQAASTTLFFMGMARVVERKAFLALVRAHLPPEAAARLEDDHVVLNMGRGTGIMHVSDHGAGQSLVEAGAAGRLQLGARTLRVEWGRAPFRPRDTTSEEHRAREVRRCVNDLCRHVATNFAAHRRELRRQRWRAQKRLLAELDAAAEAEGRIGRHFCWDFAASGGTRCPRGTACPFSHDTAVSIAALPPSVRLAVAKADAFQAHHAASPHKARVNAALARLGAGPANPRCLVLDDAHLHTVRALLGDPRRRRRPAHIVVPNVVTETYLRIEATGLCAAVPGSVRAYLDGLPAQDDDDDKDDKDALVAPTGTNEDEEDEAGGGRIGLVYLDYCGRLSAGKGNVELSPVEDLKILFAKRLPDPRGCVLAVCLRREKEPEAAAAAIADAPYDDGSGALRRLVCELAAQHGREALPLEDEMYHYGEHFVSVFRLQAARQ